MMNSAVYTKLAAVNEVKWMNMDVRCGFHHENDPDSFGRICSALAHHRQKAGTGPSLAVSAGIAGVLKWLLFVLLVIVFILISVGELFKREVIL